MRCSWVNGPGGRERGNRQPGAFLLHRVGVRDGLRAQDRKAGSAELCLDPAGGQRRGQSRIRGGRVAVPAGGHGAARRDGPAVGKAGFRRVLLAGGVAGEVQLPIRTRRPLMALRSRTWPTSSLGARRTRALLPEQGFPGVRRGPLRLPRRGRGRGDRQVLRAAGRLRRQSARASGSGRLPGPRRLAPAIDVSAGA